MITKILDRYYYKKLLYKIREYMVNYNFDYKIKKTKYSFKLFIKKEKYKNTEYVDIMTIYKEDFIKYLVCFEDVEDWIDKQIKLYFKGE